MEEKMRMKEREFEYSASCKSLGRERAALQQRAQAATSVPAGPGTAYNLLVQQSELVNSNQKVSITAATLTQLEAALQAELNLQVEISILSRRGRRGD